MKKRVRTAPANPYYSNEPAVSTSKMADKAIVPTPAARPPKMVDRNPGKMSGIAGFVSKTKPKGHTNVTVPKFGTTAKQPARMSVGKAHVFRGKK